MKVIIILLLIRMRKHLSTDSTNILVLGNFFVHIYPCYFLLDFNVPKTTEDIRRHSENYLQWKGA
ncbi:MAG: hypothetical protein ACK53Y_19060, partial [bacterium]|jgi:hypothetical protein